MVVVRRCAPRYCISARTFPALPDATAISDPEIRERLSRGRFALTVGTFGKIRKNHVLLLDLWEELLANPDFDLDLVIVGMAGWRVDDVIQRLRAMPGFGTRIHWFERMSDVGVSWLYEHCHVFLFPSLYEGWGLPVVEALRHGRPVIASTRGAAPGAAFGMATLVDPDDRAAWRLGIAGRRQGTAPGGDPSTGHSAMAGNNPRPPSRERCPASPRHRCDEKDRSAHRLTTRHPRHGEPTARAHHTARALESAGFLSSSACRYSSPIIIQPPGKEPAVNLLPALPVPGDIRKQAQVSDMTVSELAAAEQQQLADVRGAIGCRSTGRS